MPKSLYRQIRSFYWLSLRQIICEHYLVCSSTSDFTIVSLVVLADFRNNSWTFSKNNELKLVFKQFSFNILKVLLSCRLISQNLIKSENKIFLKIRTCSGRGFFITPLNERNYFFMLMFTQGPKITQSIGLVNGICDMSVGGGNRKWRCRGQITSNLSLKA